MSARLRRVLHLSAGLVCLSGLAPAPADGLKHDPFARPGQAPRAGPAAPGRPSAVKSAVPRSEWKPELRAIVMAGANSMVNVGGALVGIGEEIHGYRLVEVHEETAVFVNSNKRVTLSLRGIKPLRDTPPRQDNRELKERRVLPPGEDDRGVAQRRDDSGKPEDK